MPELSIKTEASGVQETMKERPLNLGELCVVSESGLQCPDS